MPEHGAQPPALCTSMKARNGADAGVQHQQPDQSTVSIPPSQQCFRCTHIVCARMLQPQQRTPLAPALEQQAFRNFTLHHGSSTLRKAELQVSCAQGCVFFFFLLNSCKLFLNINCAELFTTEGKTPTLTSFLVKKNSCILPYFETF